MKTKLMLVASFTLISIISKAQYENIDLNKYKLSNYKYKSLSTQLDLSNNLNSTNDDVSSSFSTRTRVDGTINYSSTIQTRKYIGNQSISLGGNFQFLNRSQELLSSTIDSTNKFSTLGIYYSTNNKFYVRNKFFWGIGITTQHRTQNNTGKGDYSKKLNTQYQTFNRLSLSVGFGRVENVTDARLAIYILDDLQKAGRVSRNLTQEEVFAFADYITSTLNKRVIDSRIKRIKEFVAIDSFLVANGLTTQTDGLYFGLLSDNWNYARTQTWETGSLGEVSVSPIFNYTNNFTRDNINDIISRTREEITYYGISFMASYSATKVIGLKWQRGWEISGAFNFKKVEMSSTNGLTDQKEITANAKIYADYIPNTRTSIRTQSGIAFSKFIGDSFNDQERINPYLLSSCNYYLSEKIRFQVNAGIYYNHYKISDPVFTAKLFNYSINAGLQYYIF